MRNSQNKLIGYWAFASETKFNAQIYIRFDNNNLLEWGYENEWVTCVMPHNYRIADNKIETTCPPNPRKELTSFKITA